MLSFSLFHNKAVIGIIFFIFLLWSVDGFELKLSPAYLNAEIEKNEIFCYNITIVENSSYENLSLKVSDVWNKNIYESKNLNDYLLNSSYVNVVLQYNSNINFHSTYNFSICILASKRGKFQGLLLFEDPNKMLSLGSWLNLSVKDSFSMSKITGFFIEGSGNLETGRKVTSELLLLGLSFFLAVLLSILLLILKKRKLLTYLVS